jgi:3',5'-cyclic AMP phosphodiesterase CpdA
MSLSVRFAVASDLHIALPHTIPDNPYRFHRVELSTQAFNHVLHHLEQLDLDFLLIPGDLTQDGEPDNHRWLSDRLAQLPYPAYIVPGNHDFVERQPTATSIGCADFPRYYTKFGYENPHQLYYTCELVPGLRLIGLNSIDFNDEGKQLGMGYVDTEQLMWLQDVLAEVHDEDVIVMIHHNVIEHLPGQARSPLGRRYMLQNAADLLHILRQGGVKLIFTGHLHVQDVAHDRGIYDITTGSMVSYPHPYRLLHLWRDDRGHCHLQIESQRIQALPGWDDLQVSSRNWVADRSSSFIVRLLTNPPLNLPLTEAEAIAPQLRDFWADIAHGDAQFSYPHLPHAVQQYFERFSNINDAGEPQFIDNAVTLKL